MLSIFPEILFLSPFAPLIIRAALGVLIASGGWSKTASSDATTRITGFCEILLAGVLLVGAWTQIAAIVATLWLVTSLLFPQFRVFPRSTAALALAMALSLIVTGPGAFAFDLPL
jgi:hypothetical protein